MISKVAHSPNRSSPRALQLQVTFQASRAPVAITCETEHSGRYPQEGCQGMCSDPLDPGEEVRGCSVGCTIAISISHLMLCSRWQVHRECPELKKMLLEAGVFWVRRDFGQFRTGGGWESRDVDQSRSSQNRSKLQLTPHTVAADIRRC